MLIIKIPYVYWIFLKFFLFLIWFLFLDFFTLGQLLSKNNRKIPNGSENTQVFLFKLHSHGRPDFLHTLHLKKKRQQ
jgi:hypothetical protein